MSPIDLDNDDQGSDWIKRHTLDLPDVVGDDNRVRLWLLSLGMPLERILRLPSINPVTRARYPALDRELRRLERSSASRPG